MAELKRRLSTSPAPGFGLGDSCSCGEAHGTPGEVRLDQLDRLLLDLMRCVCAGYASGEVVNWDRAFHLADHTVGPLDGANFVASVIALLRAVQIERQTPFEFATAGCPRITRDETSLLSIVGAARRGDAEAFTAALGAFATVATPVRCGLAVRAIASLCLRYELSIDPATVAVGEARRRLN